MRKRLVLINRESVSVAEFTSGKTMKESFRNVAAAVDGPDGALLRYCPGVILDVRGKITPPEANPPDPPDFDAVLDMLFKSVTWKRYGGEFCSELSGLEIALLNLAEGVAGVTKLGLIGPLNLDNHTAHQPFYASIVLPYSPSFFSAGNTNQKHQVDAPFPCSLLGAAGQISHTLKANLPAGYTIDEPGLVVSWYAWLFETPDTIEARPSSYKVYNTQQDPAQLPTPFCKVSTLIAVPPDKDHPFTFVDSEDVQPVVTVDGTPMTDDIVAHELAIGRGWLRPDGGFVPALFAGGYPSGFVLLDPFETDRWIELPAGTTWTVKNIGKKAAGDVRYLFRIFEECTKDVLVKQMVNQGLPPGSVNDKNRSINSNALTDMNLSERDRLGLPVRVGDNRFKG